MRIIAKQNDGNGSAKKLDVKEENRQSLYQKREKIYCRQIWGDSQKVRLVVSAVIYGAFFLLPWISWKGQPAVHFDLPGRQFHIFSLNFWPQDFVFLAWGLMIAAFSLFFFTSIAGRLWCGFACPQTIWTLLFIWIEDKVEGKPHVRKRRDKQPLSMANFSRKLFKHGLWLLVSLLTAFAFIAYFYTPQALLFDILHWQLLPVAVFWLGVFTYLTYIDAGWLREQVCTYMCPYARFQSVMYDEDTLMVTYHPERGEPRTSLKQNNQAQQGDCIDCTLCVQVCPTGIDIRDGVQINCINCGLCIDACDHVMASVGKNTKLIDFDSINGLKGKGVSLWRPKTMAYLVVLIILTSAFSIKLITREPIEANILRDRAVLSYQVDDTLHANDYLVKITNKSGEERQYRLHLVDDRFSLKDNSIRVIPAGEMMEYDITLLSSKEFKGSYPVEIEIIDIQKDKIVKTLETRFIGL